MTDIKEEVAVKTTSKFRSRKWMAMIAIVTLATIMLLVEKISGDLWFEMVVWVYGLFAGANVMNKKFQNV